MTRSTKQVEKSIGSFQKMASQARSSIDFDLASKRVDDKKSF